VKQSGLEPRDLVFALVDKFGVRLAGRRKGSKRGRRRRTKITAELRDAVKKALKGGASMNATSKHFGISYAVVVKMNKGHYDKLK
jgi:DNA invertase Pin-like site-specific DNA recombinase